MADSAESIQSGAIVQENALTRSQLMIWTGQNLQPSDPLYNMVLTFRIRGRIDEAAFTAAFRELVANSDSLWSAPAKGLRIVRLRSGNYRTFRT
jgi:hypothetical protein